MRTKNIVIIVLTVLVTIILMKNTEEVNFWIFGNHSIPKLLILGIFFLIGLVVGYMLRRPKREDQVSSYTEIEPAAWDTKNTLKPPYNRPLDMDDEDEEYIR